MMKKWTFWVVIMIVAVAVVLRLLLHVYLHPFPPHDPLLIVATVTVVDEDGKPIKDAEILLCTCRIKTPTSIPGYDSYDSTLGKTNSGGKASMAAQGDLAKPVSVSVSKNGYYPSRTNIQPVSGKTADWRPKARLTLRKKQNPVPMYGKDVCLLIYPATPFFQNGPGYDLIKEDWIKPRGKGEVADFIFHFQQILEKGIPVGMEATLTFANPDDGIMFYPVPAGRQSLFKLPYEAPLEGYKNQLVLGRGVISENEFLRQLNSKNFLPSDKQEDPPLYIFRIRTIRDKDGKIISACYGKTKGKITVVTTERMWPRVEFLYYLNPDPKSRSLEFNTTKPLSNLERLDNEVRMRLLTP